jgi:hypothetical protein
VEKHPNELNSKEMGLIVRTAGSPISKNEINNDLIILI